MKIQIVITVACLGLINCRPSAGGSGTTSAGSGTNSGSSSGSGIPCSTDNECFVALDAGNCVDGGGGAFCETCGTNADCASYGFSANYTCKSETCVFVDAGPAAGHCNVSCDCSIAGQACVSTVCATPPAMCNADTDCQCHGICQSHHCIGTCRADAGNTDCMNPFPKCYAAFGYCSHCVSPSDCPAQGQTCLPDGTCGVAPATTSASGSAASSGSGATSGAGTGTNGGATSGVIGGLIGGTSGSTSGSFLFQCDPTTGAGCPSGQSCDCFAGFMLPSGSASPGMPCATGTVATICF